MARSIFIVPFALALLAAALGDGAMSAFKQYNQDTVVLAFFFCPQVMLSFGICHPNDTGCRALRAP
jgi:hypothetical protein